MEPSKQYLWIFKAANQRTWRWFLFRHGSADVIERRDRRDLFVCEIFVGNGFTVAVVPPVVVSVNKQGQVLAKQHMVGSMTDGSQLTGSSNDWDNWGIGDNDSGNHNLRNQGNPIGDDPRSCHLIVRERWKHRCRLHHLDSWLQLDSPSTPLLA